MTQAKKKKPPVKKKLCHLCKTAPWTCGRCGVKCCEHRCGCKHPDGSGLATCGSCWGKGWQ